MHFIVFHGTFVSCDISKFHSNPILYKFCDFYTITVKFVFVEFTFVEIALIVFQSAITVFLPILILTSVNTFVRHNGLLTPSMLQILKPTAFIATAVNQS